MLQGTAPSCLMNLRASPPETPSSCLMNPIVALMSRGVMLMNPRETARS